MVTFIFPPDIQKGLLDGTYKQVFSKTGEVLSMVRDANTGQIAGHAVGTVSDPLSSLIRSILPSLTDIPLQPIISPIQPLLTGLSMYQTHRGFRATLKGIEEIKSSLGVLQATTSIIGVGVAASAGLSAVNLWQTLKLREDVKQLRLEVKDGFIELKKVLNDAQLEILERLNDVKFEQHRIELVKAYGSFLEATKLMKIAMSCDDISIRNADLANARQTLGNALAIYNNPHLLSETCASGKLRRFECAWAIEQTIVITYQLQNQLMAVSDRVSHLQDKIRQDCQTVLNSCQPENEIDFIFPEIIHIYHHELAALDSWKNHVDWLNSLSPSEKQMLTEATIDRSEIVENDLPSAALTKPAETMLYEDYKKKSHPHSLRDQLRLLFVSQLRQEYEAYISEKAIATGYNSLVPANVQQASNLTLANLYWYFQSK